MSARPAIERDEVGEADRGQRGSALAVPTQRQHSLLG